MRISKPSRQQIEALKLNDRIYFIFLGQVVDGVVQEIDAKTVKAKVSLGGIERTVKVNKSSINSIK